MPYILQVDFIQDGPFGKEMYEAYADLAKSINEEKEFKWKIWTENEETKEVGGIYLFELKLDAENYLTMHSNRLESYGITEVNGKIFKANEALTTIKGGPMK